MEENKNKINEVVGNIQSPLGTNITFKKATREEIERWASGVPLESYINPHIESIWEKIAREKLEPIIAEKDAIINGLKAELLQERQSKGREERPEVLQPADEILQKMKRLLDDVPLTAGSEKIEYIKETTTKKGIKVYDEDDKTWKVKGLKDLLDKPKEDWFKATLKHITPEDEPLFIGSALEAPDAVDPYDRFFGIDAYAELLKQGSEPLFKDIKIREGKYSDFKPDVDYEKPVDFVDMFIKSVTLKSLQDLGKVDEDKEKAFKEFADKLGKEFRDIADNTRKQFENNVKYYLSEIAYEKMTPEEKLDNYLRKFTGKYTFETMKLAYQDICNAMPEDVRENMQYNSSVKWDIRNTGNPSKGWKALEAFTDKIDAFFLGSEIYDDEPCWAEFTHQCLSRSELFQREIKLKISLAPITQDQLLYTFNKVLKPLLPDDSIAPEFRYARPSLSKSHMDARAMTLPEIENLKYRLTLEWDAHIELEHLKTLSLEDICKVIYNSSTTIMDKAKEYIKGTTCLN